MAFITRLVGTKRNEWAFGPFFIYGFGDMGPVNDRLNGLLQPVVEAMGYEWVGLEYIGGQRGPGVLRIYIDKEAGITLDDCGAVSHQLSGVLDLEDPIHENYHLEISSPGLDRPLFTAEHFRRFAGCQAQVKLHGKWQNRRKLQGVLGGVEEDEVLLSCDGEEYRVPLAVIQSARLVPEV
jgi:ribosome maturation factor RimP